MSHAGVTRDDALGFTFGFLVIATRYLSRYIDRGRVISADRPLNVSLTPWRQSLKKEYRVYLFTGTGYLVLTCRHCDPG